MVIGSLVPVRVGETPEADGEPLGVHAVGRKALEIGDAEVGRARPAGHLRFGEAEPAMGVVGAQELEPVRREVDDQHLAARLQRPPRLRQHAARIVEIVQHLVDDDEIGHARR